MLQVQLSTVPSESWSVQHCIGVPIALEEQLDATVASPMRPSVVLLHAQPNESFAHVGWTPPFEPEPLEHARMAMDTADARKALPTLIPLPPSG